MSHKAGETLTPNGMRGNELLFAKPVAVFLADLAHGFADFLQMLRHCTFYRIAITFLQGREKSQDAGVTAFLVEKRGRNSYSARDQRSLSGSQWYPTPVDSRQSASGVDGSCHQVQKIIQLLALNGNALLVKILFQLVALAFGNHARRPTRHRALNGLTDKTAVAHLAMEILLT